MYLIDAVKRNDEAEVLRLLKPGAKTPDGKVVNIREVDSEWQGTALYWAALYGHQHLLEPLVAAGIPLEQADKVGATPIYPAAWYGYTATVETLIALGASHSAPNKDGATPVFVAAQQGHITALTALLELGADARVKTTKWGTALDIAQKGTTDAHRACVQVLQAHLKQYPSGVKPVSKAVTPVKISSGKELAAPEEETPRVATPKASTTPAVPTPPPATPTSSAKSTLDAEGKLTVQFTIPYEALTVSSTILGSGAFGVVYTGRYQFGDVAIKLLHAHKLSAEALAEFMKEIVLMGQMSHPHIVRVFGACFETGRYALVMELMSVTLHDVLHNGQHLPQKLRARIATDVSSGLAYLHSRGVVHRDLKSFNVLLDDAMRAKITDFGLASAKTETQSISKREQSTAGTIRWMAPELLEGEPCTEASDMHSFGWVLWELASQKIPYSNTANETIVMKLIENGKKELIPEDCPPEMAEVINQCWKMAPGERVTSPEANRQLSTWSASFFPPEPQGVSTRTEMRQRFDGLDEKVNAAVAVLLPPASPS